jgi:MurNAc alpha-1-phosphate uridylyltransferase
MRVMLLAAGRGERMRPLTDRLPKPLLEVAGKPLVVWLIERLAAASLREIVINVSHLGHLFREALGDGSRLGVSIEYSPEASALETAGGIAKALPLLGEAPFLAINADVFVEYPFGTLRGALEPQADAHLVLVDNPPHHPGGDFALDADRVTNAGARLLTFSGMGVYRPALFAGIARGSRTPLAPLLRAAASAGRVTGERFDGRWVDVGTPERLAALDAALRAERDPAGKTAPD